MEVAELQNYMDKMILLSDEIAHKDKITPDDKTRLKAITQGVLMIKQQLSYIEMQQLNRKIEGLESLMKRMDAAVMEG